VTNEIKPPGFFFTWDIHYQCNYYCTYCFLHFEPETSCIKAKYLELQEWVDIWESMYKQYGFCQISITGGEPFTYPNFIDLISVLQKWHTFEFSTNLSWDTDEFMKKVKPERVRINSSFHPEFVSVQDFINKVLFLRNNKYQISITVVAYPPFLKDIAEYKNAFEKEGLGLIIFPYRGPCDDKKYPEAYTDSEKDFLKKLGVSIGVEANKELYETWVERKVVREQDTICRMGQRYAKITPNGNAHRCCAAVHKDWGNLGNVTDNTFSFTKEPLLCLQRSKNCVCHKAMILGEEDKWLKRWDSIDKQPVTEKREKAV